MELIIIVDVMRIIMSLGPSCLRYILGDVFRASLLKFLRFAIIFLAAFGIK